MSNKFRKLLPFSGIVIILLSNYFLRHNLERSDYYIYSFLDYFFPNETQSVFTNYTWWKLLLPIKEFTGVWNSNLVMIYLLQKATSPAISWYVSNAVIILVAFFFSWFVFRSFIFSYTLAICMGFGTQLYHTYSVSGSVGYNILIAFFIILMYLSYKIITNANQQPLWKTLFIITLLMTAIQYEGWLDYLVFTWFGSVFLAIILWRQRARKQLEGLLFVAVSMNLIAALYIYIKFSYVGFVHTEGIESDVIFNYPYLSPAIEDAISNYFTHLYLVITNFLPPPFFSSNALFQYGGQELINQQHGYHSTYAFLVPLHYQFFWRYFAGAFFVIFAYYLMSTTKKAILAPTQENIALAVFMIMAAVTGPTHTFIKFRPMNSVPLLTYHVMVGILGISLVISLLLYNISKRCVARPMVGYTIVGLCWLIILLAAITRPMVLDHLNQLVGLSVGTPHSYPNPLKTIINWFVRIFIIS